MLGAAGVTVVDGSRESEMSLVELARDADAIMTNWRRVPSEALEQALRCRVVCRYGIGVDNIPVERATELGILVVNVPGFCVDEVSDHTLALLLACARRIVPLAQGTRDGVWSTESAWGIPRLRGLTLGLVGFGSLARAVAEKARAFGLEVAAYTPRLTAAAAGPGVRVHKRLHDLLRTSDFVSLHAPSTPATRGLIGEAELRAMKPTAYLLNTARGALVDEPALGRALDEGWIAGAALDVVDGEPPEPERPLLRRADVLVTPHVAFYSDGSIAELQRRTAEQALQALRGEVPAHVVNPQVLEQENCRLPHPSPGPSLQSSDLIN